MKYHIGQWVRIEDESGCRVGQIVRIHRGERNPYEVRIVRSGIYRFKESDLKPDR